MSALLLSALAAGSSGQSALYVDDVFSTYLYTGNGSTQTINNGIDLAGKGGLVWAKSRSNNEHCLKDTVRGGLHQLKSNSTSASVNNGTGGITAFNSSGYSIGNLYDHNASGQNFVSWTFRKAPKFFDVVTYTGNGVAGRQIAHSLGVAPGMIIVKDIGAANDWIVYNRGAGNNKFLTLNSTDAATPAADWGNTDPTATHFTVGSRAFNNGNGNTYVAYLFAHDPSADGIIQCGSFATDGSGNAAVNLGWANGSQFAMIKTASTTGDWEMYDTARTSAWSGNDARLRTNLSSAEDSVARISASGTSITFAGLTANSTYIYMAIRSPS